MNISIENNCLGVKTISVLGFLANEILVALATMVPKSSAICQYWEYVQVHHTDENADCLLGILIMNVSGKKSWNQDFELVGWYLSTPNKANQVALNVFPNSVKCKFANIEINVPTAVKRKLSFQQAICYLSLCWVNILHAWTVNSVNRLVKNPKHITAITFPFKPNTYSSASQTSSLSFVMRMAILTNSSWCKWIKLRFGWRGDCCNVFWILNQSVHRI